VDNGKIDDHFLPLDRRGPVASSGVPPEPHMLEQATTLRSIALSGDGPWEDLLAEARRLQDEERGRLADAGFDVAPNLVLELSSTGRPTHVQVRLLPFAGAPPPGFERRDDCKARARFLSHPSQIAPALTELGLRTDGLAWVLVQDVDRPAGAALQLVVLEPAGPGD
jgi:hypothetical protein